MRVRTCAAFMDYPYNFLPDKLRIKLLKIFLNTIPIQLFGIRTGITGIIGITGILYRSRPYPIIVLNLRFIHAK